MQEERWIEADALGVDDDDDDDPTVGDLFADPDPREVFDFSFDNGRIQIAVEGIKAENGQTLNSTGLTLWRAAPQLCNYMVNHARNQIEGKRVIELGAGLGLSGILAHKLGAAHVALTDGDTDTLVEMRNNVERNCSTSDSIQCRQLLWGKNIDNFIRHYGRFDVILASDVIYLEEMLEPLFDTVVALLEPAGGRFLLSYARRNVNIDLVFDAARRHGLQWSQPRASEGVYVMEHNTLSK